MRCSKRGNDDRDRRKFCPRYWAQLKPVCPASGAENEPEKNFGVAVLQPRFNAAAATRPSAAMLTALEIHVTPEYPDASTLSEGERKTVTAKFADIKGSMVLM